MNPIATVYEAIIKLCAFNMKTKLIVLLFLLLLHNRSDA